MKGSSLLHLICFLPLFIYLAAALPTIGARSASPRHHHEHHHHQHHHSKEMNIVQIPEQGFYDEKQLDASQKHTECLVYEVSYPMIGRASWGFDLNLTGWGHAGRADRPCGSGIKANLKGYCWGIHIGHFECTDLGDNKLNIKFRTPKLHKGGCVNRAVFHATWDTWKPPDGQKVCEYDYKGSLGRFWGSLAAVTATIVDLPGVGSFWAGMGCTFVGISTSTAIGEFDRLKAAAHNAKAKHKQHETEALLQATKDQTMQNAWKMLAEQRAAWVKTHNKTEVLAPKWKNQTLGSDGASNLNNTVETPLMPSVVEP